MLFARRGNAPRSANQQGGNVRWESAFGLDLQEAGEIGFRQFGQLDVGGKCQLQREAQHAVALADTGRVKMIADFAPDQFGGRRQGVE